MNREEMDKLVDQASDGDADGSVSMVIGGVDLADLQAAHAAHPILARWHETTLKLIPDIYDLAEAGGEGVQILKARVKELEDKLAELEGEDDDKPDDAEPGVPKEGSNT